MLTFLRRTGGFGIVQIKFCLCQGDFLNFSLPQKVKERTRGNCQNRSTDILDHLKGGLESISATVDKEHDRELKLNPITRVELLNSKGPCGPNNEAKRTEMTINAGPLQMLCSTCF